MRVAVGFSSALAASEAVDEISTKFHTPRLIIFFAPEKQFADLTFLFQKKFPSCDIVGVTMQYAFAHGKVLKNQISAIAFSEGFSAVCGVVENASHFPSKFKFRVADALQKIPEYNTICLEFMTAFSMNEDVVAESLQSVAGKIPVLGGCASVAMESIFTNVAKKTFSQTASSENSSDILENPFTQIANTAVSLNGTVYKNACVFVFLHNETGRIFSFTEDIFKPTKKSFVATSVDFARQTIRELNGMPALTALAKAYGVRKEDAVLLVRDYPLCRAGLKKIYMTEIIKINDDESLTMNTKVFNGIKYFLCAPENYNEVTKNSIAKILHDAGDSAFVLVLASLARTMFYLQERYLGEWTQLWTSNIKNAVGVSCAGIQIVGRHFNSTNLIIGFE